MRTVALAGAVALALSPSLSFAQATASPAVPQLSNGKPADLCQELLAFMRAPPPQAPAGEPVKSPPPDASAPAGNSQESAQDASGQAGPAHTAPDAGGQIDDETTVQNAELKSSLSAPAPKDSTSTPKTSVLSLAEAEEIASAGDIPNCRDATRKLRLAGVAVPTPLLALAALDLRLHQSEGGQP